MEYWVETGFLVIHHHSIIPTFQYSKGDLDDTHHFNCWKIG
jgi:hypothetical protein